MVEEFGERDAAQLARPAVIRASVINHFDGVVRVDDDHGVPRRRLAELAIEEQVAREGRTNVAAHEKSVALDKGFRIGKLREGSVGNISGLKRAGTHTEGVCG
jgi:hypothetical protein